MSATLRTNGIISGRAWTVASGPDLPRVAHALLLDASGQVQVRYAHGGIDTLTLSGGIWHPIQIDQIISADAATVHLGYLEPEED